MKGRAGQGRKGGLRVLVPKVRGGERAFYSQTSQFKLLFPFITSSFTFKLPPPPTQGKRPGDTPLTPGAANSCCSHRVHASINANWHAHMHTQTTKSETVKGGINKMVGVLLKGAHWNHSSSPLALAFSSWNTTDIPLCEMMGISEVFLFSES